MTGVEELHEEVSLYLSRTKCFQSHCAADSALWNRIAAEMPAYLDSEGLLKYFPSHEPRQRCSHRPMYCPSQMRPDMPIPRGY